STNKSQATIGLALIPGPQHDDENSKSHSLWSILSDKADQFHRDFSYLRVSKYVNWQPVPVSLKYSLSARWLRWFCRHDVLLWGTPTEQESQLLLRVERKSYQQDVKEAEIKASSETASDLFPWTLQFESPSLLAVDLSDKWECYIAVCLAVLEVLKNRKL